MSKIGDAIKRKLTHAVAELLLRKNTSEFWMGPVNIIVQFILRKIGPMFGGDTAALAQQLADLLLTLLPVAAGRVISKVAKG